MQLEIILTVVVVALTAIILLAIHFRSKAKAADATVVTDETEAPSLKPFSNPITFSILMVCVLLIAIGIILAVSGNFWGVVIGGVGILIWWAGDTSHPQKPRTVGILTFWDSFIAEDSGGVAVGGRTILANYFPFFLTSVQFEITNRDQDFPMTIITKDNMRVPGKISLTLQPDVNDGVDYVQAGEMDEIIPQLDDIVFEEAQEIGAELGGLALAKKPSLLSEPLRQNLKNQFQSKSFGVKVVKIQARFDMPQKVVDAMDDQAAEAAQRQGEEKEASTNIAIMKTYQEALDVTPKEAWDEFKTARLIRDGRVARIETGGKTGNIILTDAKLNMGEKPRKEK